MKKKKNAISKEVKIMLKYRVVVVVTVVIVVSLTFLGLRHFFISIDKQNRDGKSKKPDVSESITSSAANQIPRNAVPIKHIHLSKEIKGKKQEIFIIEADVSNKKLKILPVLSSDLIYGFELLSSMVNRKQAFAATNGGFFSRYGIPSGMVAIDGNVVTASKGKYPVFYIDSEKAYMKELTSRLWLESDVSKHEISDINREAAGNEIIAYTPAYGTTNRAKNENVTITIREGRIDSIIQSADETEIPKNGMVVSYFGAKSQAMGNIAYKIGDYVKLIHEPFLNSSFQAYECGSWLIKDGIGVSGEKDEFVGVLTNNDPRTAVGIKSDGTAVFVVVDGRQPGYSAGVTGKELSEFLLEYGVKNAAMLDGGASSEMIYDGKMVNRPSFKGQERPLAGGIIFMLEK